MYKIYQNLNALSDDELNTFWNFIFKNSDSFSLRFSNINHSVSNSMKIRYNDSAEIDENFNDYLKKNETLISYCNNNIIKKYVSNSYVFDKYGNLSVIYICRMFDYIKNLIYKYPNVYEWLEPDLPEDICFYKDNTLLMYNCSHENISFIFLTEKQFNSLNTEMKLIICDCYYKKCNIDLRQENLLK